MSGSRIPSAGWALLILPIALFVGLFLGRTPALDRAPTPREAPKQTARANAQETQATASRLSVEAAERKSIEAPPPFIGEGEHRVAKVSSPTPVISSWTTFDAAVLESGQNGKPILLDFNAEWCPPCQRLKRELFDEYEGGVAVRTAVIPVSLVDRQREDGENPPQVEQLQRRFGIDAFPTLVVFTPATGREERMRGYAGREATLRWIESAAAAVR